ncbi:MAG: hypothetical protein ACKVQR_10305 [Aquabacterium sp.]
MLDRVDRMLLAVGDHAQAAQTFIRLLDARPLRQSASSHLGARGTVLALGASEIELWTPDGAGPMADHLQRHGEGLFAAGYASAQLPVLQQRLRGQGVAFIAADDRLYLSGAATRGYPMVVSALQAARPAAGPVSFFYEATHALDEDWQGVARHHADTFGLDASRFCPIGSARFGYAGTLTMFDPVDRLDRIELSQTFADQPGAMRRFVERRGGNALYMCFAEAHDFPALRDRLLAAGARVTPRSPDIRTERDTLWVHPRDLHGMLLGVSRTGFAWDWSGQPQRIPALDD